MHKEKEREKGWEASCSSDHLGRDGHGASCTWRSTSGRKGWTRGSTQKHQERAPNRERKVGLIGCRRRNLVVSICHSVARERVPAALRPPAFLSFALSPFFLVSPRFLAFASLPSRHDCTLTRNLSLNSAVALVRTDVSRILREFWSPFETSLEFDPRISEVAPKIPRLPPDPFFGAHLSPLPLSSSSSKLEIREIWSIQQLRVWREKLKAELIS